MSKTTKIGGDKWMDSNKRRILKRIYKDKIERVHISGGTPSFAIPFEDIDIIQSLIREKLVSERSAGIGRKSYHLTRKGLKVVKSL